MNRIVQILSTESVNTSNIYLYREGIFYKVYERSAYAFVTGVQKFMVKKKFVKCANQEVVSIGFPCDGLYKHFTKEQVIERDNGIQVKLEQQIDVTAFEQWKHSIMLTSNIYLNRLDQMVKRQLREKHYGRYVDDSYIINRCYATLRMHKETIRRYLHEELGLTLHPKKSKIVRCCYGIDFLGVFVKPHRRYINNRTKKRIFRKSVPLFNCTDTEKLRAGINSYLGYMKHFKCGKIKERLFGGKPQLELLGEFIGHYSKFSLSQPELKRTGS